LLGVGVGVSVGVGVGVGVGVDVGRCTFGCGCECGYECAFGCVGVGVGMSAVIEETRGHTKGWVSYCMSVQCLLTPTCTQVSSSSMAGSLAKVVGNIDLVPYYNDGSNGTGNAKVGKGAGCQKRSPFRQMCASGRSV